LIILQAEATAPEIVPSTTLRVVPLPGSDSEEEMPQSSQSSVKSDEVVLEVRGSIRVKKSSLDASVAPAVKLAMEKDREASSLGNI